MIKNISEFMIDGWSTVIVIAFKLFDKFVVRFMFSPSLPLFRVGILSPEMTCIVVIELGIWPFAFEFVSIIKRYNMIKPKVKNGTEYIDIELSLVENFFDDWKRYGLFRAIGNIWLLDTNILNGSPPKP